MNEVEKMYENAGIEPDINYVCDKEPCEKHSVDCQECSHLYDTREDYPDFTAEKQLYIIIWLSDKDDYIGIHYDKYKGLFNIQTNSSGLCVCNEFEQALASMVNFIWQDLTDTEKAQIKEILE